MTNSHHESGFLRFLMEGKRGERYVYHTGELAYDRGGIVVNLKKMTKGQTFYQRVMTAASLHADAMADHAWQAHRRGDVLLCQKRKDDKRLDYIAVKT